MFPIGELLYFVKMEFDSFELHKKSINMNTLNAANINVQGRREGFLFHSQIELPSLPYIYRADEKECVQFNGLVFGSFRSSNTINWHFRSFYLFCRICMLCWADMYKYLNKPRRSYRTLFSSLNRQFAVVI